MGKNLQHQDTLSLDNVNPGCMRGIFHHWKYHHKWHNVKKRLPYKRHSGGKHASVAGDPGNNSNTTDPGEAQGVSNNAVKSSEHGSSHKSSVTSRIKALITEEVSRRRARHRRSSSYPTRVLERSPSFHHLEASNLIPSTETGLNVETLDHQDQMHSTVFSLLDPLLPNSRIQSVTNSKTCELCAAMLTMNYLRQSEVNERGRQPIKDHTLVQDSSIYAIEPSKNASLQESKLFLDALDLLNMRKELFLKVLEDPNSSLSHQLHGHKASIMKLGLTKSVSFPVPGSSGRKVPTPNCVNSKQENGPSTEEENKLRVSIEEQNLTVSAEELERDSTISTGTCTDDEAPKQLLMMPDPPDDALLDSTKESKDQHKNKLVIKRFKYLREKIKHAIKESKKERRRIIMDGVLHKVPYGHEYPKDVKEEGDMHTEKYNKYSPGSTSRSDQFSAFGKSGFHCMRRTSSFNESLDRYNRLLELCLNKESNQVSDCLIQKTTDMPSSVGSSPISLERILSLPDLRSYSFSRIEGSTGYDSSETPIRPVLIGNSSVGSSRFIDQKPPHLENQIYLDASQENECSENSLEAGDICNDSGILEKKDNVSHHDCIIVPTIGSMNVSNLEEDAMTVGSTNFSTVKVSELTPDDSSPFKEDLANFQKESSLDFPILPENNISKVETPRKQSCRDLLHVQVDRRIETEFNYVRDVLELSGFSGNGLLGRWHSAEQPLDPLVFEEVEGSLLAEPASSENEEGVCWDHPLLFDLINEVLLDIYERSFSYWPMPLTCRSHVHPMPAGHHVLDEVWTNISWYLNVTSGVDQSLDDAVSRDLAKGDGWMNIQFEAECAGLELEDLIFDDLLDELILT